MIKRIAMKLARSKTGGALAWLGLTKLRFLLPVKTHAADKTAVMLAHPSPMEAGHCLIVPARRVKSLFDLAADEAEWRTLTDFIHRNVDVGTRCLCCNTGKKQEVGQAHFHVLDRAKRSLGDGPQTGWRLDGRGRCLIAMSDLDNIAVLREALAAGTRAYPDGMSVFWL